MNKCPWCQGFELTPSNPTKSLCVKHLREYARKFPERVKARKR